VTVSRAIAILLLLPVGASAIAGSSNSTAIPSASYILGTPCWFESGPGWPQSECGTLAVPEDYSKPEGRQIRLPFIIFKAYVHDRHTSPLLVAGGGGPGIALGIAKADWAGTDYPLWTSWSDSTVSAGRDLILIDNRGVGTAEPGIDCVEIKNAAKSVLAKTLEHDELIRLIRTSYAACKRRLEQQGIDLSQYQVINAAEDIEQLRLALGIRRLNIYGGSYASRVALAYERLHPDSARALVLDGVIPESIRIYEEEPRRNYEAIMRVLDKCNRDSRCYRRYGSDLDKRLADYLAELDASPVTINVDRKDSDQPVEVRVTASMFFDSLYTDIYDPDEIRKIPGYLYDIFSGKLDVLAKLVGENYVAAVSNDNFYVGAYASYACYDEIPFVDFKEARSELMKYPFQQYSNAKVFDHMQAMCEVWDVPAAPAELKKPYKIDTPLLIYAGELDPVTPAEMATPIIENARRWWAKVWPDNSHEVIHHSECADLTAGVFLRDPESNPFVLECDRNRSGFEQKY